MRRRGIVFIVTLAMMSIVVLSVSLYARDQQQTVQITINRNELRRAKYAAEAAIAYALADLQAVAESPTEPVTLDDDWAQRGTQGGDEFQIGKDSFRMQIIDNSSKLDINTASEQQLLNLGLTQEQVDSLLDWREQGTNARANGAKDDYYNNLPNRYNAHLARLQSVYEVLDVQFFTPQDLFVAPADLQNTTTTGNGNTVRTQPLIDVVGIDNFSGLFDPQGNGKTNVNQLQLQAQQLSQTAQITIGAANAIISARNAQVSQQFTSMSQILGLPGVAANPVDTRNILDRVTISANQRVEGRININTCSAEVLATVPNIDQETADRIVNNRPDGGYRQLSDLISISNAGAFLGSVADNLCTTSQSFTVRAVGRAGRIQYALEALIVIENNVPKVVRVERPPFSDMPLRWQWADGTNPVVVLE